MSKPGSMGRNICFGVREAYFKNNPGNTCFPDFLKEGIQRKAGRAFESLNSNTHAVIPKEGGPLAIGVGTSIKDRDNNLLSSLRFKFKNNVFTISKWE